MTSSELWKRAKRASRRFVEVPFEILVSREELGLSDGPADVLLKGAMDLVFEEKGDWFIVDWKSDAVGGEPRRPRRALCAASEDLQGVLEKANEAASESRPVFHGQRTPGMAGGENGRFSERGKE